MIDAYNEEKKEHKPKMHSPKYRYLKEKGNKDISSSNWALYESYGYDVYEWYGYDVQESDIRWSVNGFKFLTLSLLLESLLLSDKKKPKLE